MKSISISATDLAFRLLWIGRTWLRCVPPSFLSFAITALFGGCDGPTASALARAL